MSKPPRHASRHSRRDFLRLAAGVTLAAATPIPVLAQSSDRAALSSTRPLSPQAFKTRLAGPILSLPTTFHHDLTINVQAVHHMIGRALRYGVPIFSLTAGNSKYNLLTYDEVKMMTRAMVEAAHGRGLTIAATGFWPIARVIEYAQYAERIGADAVQVLHPQEIDQPEPLYQYFLEISRNTALPIALHGNYSVESLRRLAEIDSIVAMKEDGRLTYYIDRMYEFGDRFEIFGGGAENRYLVGYPYGARAFYSTYTGFAPDIPMRFWEAIRRDDLKTAVKITTTYDYPFIRRFTHPFWHATLEHFGVATRYMRKPFETWPESRLDEVTAFFRGQGLDPAKYRD